MYRDAALAIDEQTIEVARQVVSFALRAPSIHNSQPWRWRLEGSDLELYADRSRQLTAADPHGRNLAISCGAALQYAVIGAAAQGWPAEVRLLPTPGDPDHLATLRLSPGSASRRDHADAELLQLRTTDRRRFIGWPMSSGLLRQLADDAALGSATALPVTNVADRLLVELLVSRAFSAERADARVVDEQQRWLAPNRAGGVPDTNSHPEPAAAPAWPSRFTDPAEEPRQEIESDIVAAPTDGLVVVATDDDTPAAWLDAGRLLCRLWPAAMDKGLSVIPMSQVVEVAETRASLRADVLRDGRHPQVLLRIGWQELARNPLPPTPRRGVEDVLDR